MTSCSLHYDIEQYRLMLAEKKIPKIPLFANLERYGAKLLEQIDLKSYEAGKAVYASFGGRSTQRRAPKISTLMLLGEIYTILKAEGYRYAIGRISSDQLRELYEQLGMKMVASIAFDIGNGKQHTLYFGVLDMENPIFLNIAQEIKDFREKERSITPKL